MSCYLVGSNSPFCKFWHLNFDQFLPYGLIIVHKTWCGGHNRYPTHNNRQMTSLATFRRPAILCHRSSKCLLAENKLLGVTKFCTEVHSNTLLHFAVNRPLSVSYNLPFCVAERLSSRLGGELLSSRNLDRFTWLVLIMNGQFGPSQEHCIPSCHSWVSMSNLATMA